MVRVILGILAATILLVVGTGGPYVSTSIAAPGTLVADVVIGEGSDGGQGGPNDGVGVAFDGRYLYYSAGFFDPILHRVGTSGGSHLDVTVRDSVSGAPVVLQAMSWDAGRARLWAGNGSLIYLVHPTTGIAEFQFSAGACAYGLDDGIAYDAADDSIWYSCDTEVVIRHFSSRGTPLGSFRVDSGPGDMRPECPPYSSGIAVGGDILYLGADGCDFYFTYDKSGNKLAAFPYPALRSEDLECDPVTFAPKEVMWIRDAYDGHIRAFEVPPGTCGGGGQEPHPRRAIIFIQGIGSGSKSDCSGDGFLNRVSWMKKYLLESAGWLTSQVTISDFRYFSYSGDYCADGVTPRYEQVDTCNEGIDEGYFPKLKNLIKDATDEVPGTKVSIVAHSQGGLIASYLVGRLRSGSAADRAFLKQRVASVITFDSFPEGMSGIEVVAADTFYDLHDPWYDDCPNEVNDTPPNLNDWNSWSLTSDVPETAENAASPFGADQYQVAFYTLYAEGIDPGPPDSATDIRGNRLHEEIPDSDHSTIWYPGTTRKGELIACSIISGLKPAGPRADTCDVRAVDTILRGQTQFASAQVPNRSSGVDFGVAWIGSTVEVTIVDPEGQRFDRYNLPPGASHSLGVNFENFSFENPKGGEWIVEMFGDDVPVGGERVTLFVNLALPDADADGLPDLEDSCPNVAEDTDGHQDADGCPDLDNDQDGVEDADDSCPDVANADQSDVDFDGIGDACDLDFVPGAQLAWGNVDCKDVGADSVDALQELRFVAKLGVNQAAGCPGIDKVVEVVGASPHMWGDVNCDGGADSLDALRILRNLAKLPDAPIAGCPVIGTLYEVR